MIMLIVVTYDLPNDKRRTRLYKALARYGEAVQLSVFECLITEAQFDQMRKDVLQVINLEEDSVRYYHICQGCRPQIKTMGKAVTTSIKPVYII